MWTPEDPFLYELAVDTGADTVRTRFGMRTFKTDPADGPRDAERADLLPCAARTSASTGSSRTPNAATLPWDREWVRKLHRRFKEMHWNSLRYCIGFPPELWYEIADEEGILIQDEFPIWYSAAKGGWPEAITPEHLAVEYTEWMRERWNHPCVVIWDAQNETANDRVIAAAIRAGARPGPLAPAVGQRLGHAAAAGRHLGRPSRIGRAVPASACANFARENGIPDNGPRKGAGPPYLINEYGWLWINRDGTLPTLTVEVYKRLLGENATVDERRQYYARTLAAKTEFWRVRRQCCGVLHFCGLGYSRPDGQTSDNFIDVKNLTYEPNFFQYVRDAFAPVGVAIDYWEDRSAEGFHRPRPGSRHQRLERRRGRAKSCCG